MKALSFALILILIASCASKPLTPEENRVRILRKSDAPAGCEEIARIYTGGIATMSDKEIDDDFKRDTFRKGGNTAVLLEKRSDGVISGVAYKCN